MKTSGYQKMFLPCLLDEGMFDSEYSIQIQLEGTSYSLFVDKERVKNGNGNKGFLSVQLIETHADFGTVVLPSVTLEEGFRTIRVPLGALTPA